METFSLETPEQVAFDYEVAGIGSRFIAALIDTFALIVLWSAFIIVAIAIISIFPQIEGNALGNLLLALLVLVNFLIFWGYYVVFEIVWNGQTPGKRLTGLRVIQTNGYPITAIASVIRNLVRVADFLPAWYALGVTVMFFNQRAMRLGDFAAGTLVVKERAPVTLDDLVKGADAVLGADLLVPSLPNLHRLSPAQLAVIHEAARRSHDPAAARVIEQVAAQVRGALLLSPTERTIPAARLLAMVVAQTRNGGPPAPSSLP